MKRAIALMVAIAVIAIPAIGIYAASGEIVLPFTVQKEDRVGPEVLLYSGAMPVFGENCEVTASDAGNNTSVHPGNAIRLDTGGKSITFQDVERAPNVSTPGSDTIIPGETGTVTLIFGPDGVYSADLILEFECVPVTTTSTTQPTSTTSSVLSSTTSTVTESTSTTSPPPTTPPTIPPVLPFTGQSDLFGLDADLVKRIAGVLGLVGIATVGLARRLRGEIG